MDSEQTIAALREQLAERERELEKSSRLKSEFVTNMSHELRTPLNAVIGFSDLLLDGRALLTDAHVEYVENIRSAGQHLLAVINSVLALAEMEAGDLALDLEEVDPNLEIDQALLLASPAAATNRVTLRSAPGSSRLVTADRQQLRQILLNLVSNAVKFSPPGSEVVVSTADEEGFLRFSVRDQGIGISEPVLRELFKPFFQVDTSMGRTYEGVGLGLAITKRLIDQQGGRIDVASAVGQGSTFSFTLPLAKAQGASSSAAPRTSAVAPPVIETPAQGARPLVLVVEDDRINARLFEAFLEHNGFAVARAWTATEALNIARRRNPQAVLLDLILTEGEDGLVVLGQLKQEEATRSIPVIVISSLPEAARSRELGASGFLIKPVEPARMVEMLRKLIVPTG